MTAPPIAGKDSTPQGVGSRWRDTYPAGCREHFRDCLATRRWVATNNVEQTRLPHPTHTHEDGGGCPVVSEGDFPSSAQMTGHSRPRRLHSMPAIHEKSNNMHPDLHRGGDPVPGKIRDCLATRRGVATNNVEQTRLPHPTHTDEDDGGCPVVSEGGATSSAQMTGHSRPRRLLSMPAIHEKSNNMHPDLHRGGDPVPGNIRDCLATRRWVATNNVEQTRLPHPTHTHEDGGGCPVVSQGDATSSAQTTGHSDRKGGTTS